MLVVDASAGESRIQGLGLIARAAIPKGAVIWVMNPKFDVVLNESQWHALSTFARQQVEKFVYLDVSTRMYVLCSDDARYMNHAEDANTTSDEEVTRTTRDILAGEELTADYREFDALSRDAASRGERLYA
jgi:SET domain-containing protein